ncbi:MAG: hypothetical protein K2I96_04995 [Lachnospiraceae bacterium]|nr:hypothetical protein [Lachnospiraceae bacterium]
MQEIEKFLENRKRQLQEDENRAYQDAQFSREFLSYEPDRTDMEEGLKRAAEEQAVSHAMIDFIDELLEEFF